jgi:hypothetical protein
MNRAILLAALIAVSSPAVAQSETRKCTSAEAVAAEVATDTLHDWADVYRFFRQFGHCFDGAIAGNASDKVQLLLANFWSEVPQLLKYTSEDSKFKAFIFSIINSEAFPRRIFEVVVKHASERCPTSATELCQTIKSAAMRMK